MQKSITKQKGAVVILMAFIIGLGVLAYALHAFDPARLRLEQDKKTYQTLNAAKEALIAWSVSHPNTPGLMPYPDRNNDGNYDDTSDCYAVNVSFNTVFTLGRLPLFQSDPNCINAKNNVSSGVLGDFRDGTGERLWYEVSQNLLHDYNNAGGAIPNGTSPIINPSIVNNPSNPWFVVRDRNGAIISDRVAAVIIAPGLPSGTQDRSGGIANANQYLDKIVMADNTPYKNYDYQLPAVTSEFIIGDDFRRVANNDPTYKDQSVEPYYYNDKLVYITIDELMAALSRRAAAEAKAQLKNYKASTGYYPYASVIGLTEYYQKNNQLYGYLPIETPTQPSTTCSVTYASANASSSTCASSVITNVEFTRSGGTFNDVTGSECIRINANRTCRCAITAGSSRCNGTAGRRFTCTTTGCATSGTLPGSYVFNGVFRFASSPTSVKANFYNNTNPYNSLGVCTGCGSNIVTCSALALPLPQTGSFAYEFTSIPAAFNSTTTGSVLSSWFTANKWQNYLFYSVSDNCRFGKTCISPADPPNITAGGKFSVEALIVATGNPILAQVHPSCEVSNYLDSAENTDIDATFDSIIKQMTSNYNDQTTIVTP